MPQYSVHLPPHDNMKATIRDFLSPLPVEPITEHRLHTTVIYFPAQDKETAYAAVERSLPQQFPLFGTGCGVMRNGRGSKLMIGFDYSPLLDMFHARIIRHMLDSNDMEFSASYRPEKYPQVHPHMAIAKVAEEQKLESIASAFTNYRWNVRYVDVVEEFKPRGKRFELTTARV